jgi:hypothetical protein
MEIWSSNITDKEYKSILKNFNDLCDNMKKKGNCIPLLQWDSDLKIITDHKTVRLGEC